MVLGNDFAGAVATTGARVWASKPGDRVYGLKPASADGTHASYVLVKFAPCYRPADGDLQALAAIPYSFVTMWLAVRGAGLTRANAAGKKVWSVVPRADSARWRCSCCLVGRQHHRHRSAINNAEYFSGRR